MKFVVEKGVKSIKVQCRNDPRKKTIITIEYLPTTFPEWPYRIYMDGRDIGGFATINEVRQAMVEIIKNQDNICP